MSAIKTTYSIESEPSERDTYELKITKEEKLVSVNIIHTHYDGSTRITSEGIFLPLDDFIKLISEIRRNI